MTALAHDTTLVASPVSWGVDDADHPANPIWTDVLDGMTAVGLRHLELGPVGYLPEDRFELATALESRDLRAVGTFLLAPLHDQSKAAETLRHAHRVCRFSRAAGGEILIIIDAVGDERGRTAGRRDEAAPLSASAWSAMVELIAQVAEIAHAHKLAPVFHPHVGSYVEFEHEIERLLDEVPADRVGLCLDTGHCIYAGIEPTELFTRHATRVQHVHLKDVNQVVLDRVKANRLSFHDAVRASIFCPLGHGCVNFARFAAALSLVTYRRFATLEQDCAPSHDPSASLADLRTSLSFLHSSGFGQ